MAWNLDSGRPLYLQIMERISLDIVSGKHQPGTKLPSVRDLASEAGVNPNTMQKALSELERKRLLHSVRTSGRFITEDGALIEKMREELASAQIRDFLLKMSRMGFTRRRIIELITAMDAAQTESTAASVSAKADDSPTSKKAKNIPEISGTHLKNSLSEHAPIKN